MRLLIDTNILIEIILQQERAEEAGNLLCRTDEHEFYISDFCLHSVGLLLFRQKRHKTFWQLIMDLILNAGVEVVSRSVEEMESVVSAAQRFNLDFDDAYQCVAADANDLILVSFDADFDRTERGRRTPADVLAG